MFRVSKNTNETMTSLLTDAAEKSVLGLDSTVGDAASELRV